MNLKNNGSKAAVAGQGGFSRGARRGRGEVTVGVSGGGPGEFRLKCAPPS